MAKIVGRDALVLASGKEIYINRGIIGLEKLENGWDMSYGYDGNISTFGPKWFQSITNAEASEIADMMIEQWKEFKEFLKTHEENFFERDKTA